eukprot:m.196467 g.196467  ORF g.196467 m.196467 type:complete len:87 (-) comp18692_c0_seq2:1019-1279(-)
MASMRRSCVVLCSTKVGKSQCHCNALPIVMFCPSCLGNVVCVARNQATLLLTDMYVACCRCTVLVCLEKLLLCNTGKLSGVGTTEA